MALLEIETLKVHFDTGNIMEYQFPEHWVRYLGKRIKNVHLKEYTKKGTDHSLQAFRPLLDGCRFAEPDVARLALWVIKGHDQDARLGRGGLREC